MVGNIPNYEPLDVIRCFLKLDSNFKSRQLLTKELELGEGTIKSLLLILKEKGLTVSKKKGHSLSAKGNALLHKINNEITLPKPITYTDFYSQLNKAAVQIKRKRKDFSVPKVRDAAVRVGAEAAYVLFSVHEHLKMSKKDTYTFKQIAHQFELKEGDIVLVSFADTYRKAELGVLAQVLYVCPNLLSMAVNSFDLELNL